MMILYHESNPKLTDELPISIYELSETTGKDRRYFCTKLVIFSLSGVDALKSNWPLTTSFLKQFGLLDDSRRQPVKNKKDV